MSRTYTVDRKSFMEAPLNDGKAVSGAVSGAVYYGKTCYCVFGAFLNSCTSLKSKEEVIEKAIEDGDPVGRLFGQNQMYLSELSRKTELEIRYRYEWDAKERDSFPKAPHHENFLNSERFHNSNADPVWKALKRFERQLIDTPLHVRTPEWQLAFKTKIAEVLEALGVQFIESPGEVALEVKELANA